MLSPAPVSMMTSSYRGTRFRRRLANDSPCSVSESNLNRLTLARCCAQKCELPCRSASISSTLRFLDRMPARLVASVVLPVPTFSASSATIMLPP